MKLLRLLVILTMTLFLAACASTGNNFDDSKIAQIKKGETTEQDLVAMFGEPQNRSVNSEKALTLTWMYMQSTIKGESFIPYAGAFMGGSRSKGKTLTVSLQDDRVTEFSYSGGGAETRGTTQSVSKK